MVLVNGFYLLLPLLSQLGDIADIGLLLLHFLLLSLRLHGFAELLVLTLLLPVKQQQQHIQVGSTDTSTVRYINRYLEKAGSPG